MSFDATEWALTQRGIRPSAKLVLFSLADRYNPVRGCFPSIETLADDCEMSARSVQDQIRELQVAGLISATKRRNSGSEFLSNQYVLSYDPDQPGSPYLNPQAIRWAKSQCGLKPAEKLVLLQLCKRFNPEHGCFPSFRMLAEDCEMSERSAKDQIHNLARSGFIFIEKQPRRGGQLPRNRYRFPFEPEFSGLVQILPLEKPQAKFALGKSACPPSANSRIRLVQNLPTNLIKEPIIEPITGRGRVTSSIRDVREGSDWLDLQQIEADSAGGSPNPHDVPDDPECNEMIARCRIAGETADVQAVRDAGLSHGLNSFWTAYQPDPEHIAASDSVGRASERDRLTEEARRRILAEVGMRDPLQRDSETA